MPIHRAISVHNQLVQATSCCVHDILLFSNRFLVLARQKQSCYRTVCFGDDPQFFSCHGFVSAQETESVLKTSGVFLAVLLFQVAPIARMVTGKKLAWALSSLLQCEQCARCCNDLPQSKERQCVDFAHDSVPFLFCFFASFAALCAARKSKCSS